MISKNVTLKATIARLLTIEFGNSGIVSYPDGQASVAISLMDCENDYGNIVQRIHRLIDECCPVRTENLFIMVRDKVTPFKNTMKIWKSA